MWGFLVHVKTIVCHLVFHEGAKFSLKKLYWRESNFAGRSGVPIIFPLTDRVAVFNLVEISFSPESVCLKFSVYLIKLD